ncbi:hypothetical protein CEW89_08515 [Celeribacter ethanolicus]|uniref:Uncharacterized protein n=1 Tax=Celeribacter ethanolicus TaxID=1758178 RepID=A0A291GC32_9RHOB|nr:hypothetical protein [Celeribacter ethanolicus]ATG47614.1 hypothetical protein CEW89_08515 [Celeribacter ethanolicus]
MSFDVVSAVVARPFASVSQKSSMGREVGRAWVRVASMYEGEIGERMVAAAVADGHRGLAPVSRTGATNYVKHASLAAQILAVLGGRVGGLTVGEIAEALGGGRVKSVMWCTGDMQSRGLVTRSKGSGASVFVAMTARGREVLAGCERVERA